MDEEQLVQVLELAYREVRSPSGLHTLPASDTHANMGLADHATIVGTVPYRQRHLRRVPHAHQSHNVALLLG